VFSGLIAHLGCVERTSGDVERGVLLVVRAPDAVAQGVEVKDSVAVNGVCLTVTSVDTATMTFDVVPETLRRTGLGDLRISDPVNIELSLRLGDRLGGHLVYGHVDAQTAIIAKESEGQGERLTLALPTDLAPYVVEKGYITVDGTSLTVASVGGGRFAIALIPETLKRTTLGTKGVGASVNLEVDPIARYAYGAVAAYAQRSV
jgi:riboflavin synthase